MRVAEEEERRLLMPASGGSFRFMVDVERLSTGREGGRTDRQGRRGLHWRLAKEGEGEEEGCVGILLGCLVGNMWPDTVNISTHTR